ncbi:MAG: TlpA family protein disulfide reductase [Bacteroidota bacterium]|nr:TlpA family protein disulfide reductase [Bacteroidota bacterium]
MKLRLFILLLFIIPSSIHAQSFQTSGYFVIKGKLKNFKETFFEFGLSDYFTINTISIVVKPNGSFEKKVPVQDIQTAYFIFNDSLFFNCTVLDKDTINMFWDNDDFANTFLVTGKNERRTKELQLQSKLRSFILASYTLPKELYEKRKELTDEQKFALINEVYNRNVQAIFDSTNFFSETIDNMITGLYFQYSSTLRGAYLLPQFKLKLALDSTRSYPHFAMLDHYFDFKQLNKNWFWNVPEYRRFIFDYIRFDVPFDSYVTSVTGAERANSFTLDYYYIAQAVIHQTTIKDWFITQSLISGFANYPFADVEKPYKLFMETCATPFLKTKVQKYYETIRLLKPGSKAPEFSLKNKRGKNVSLSDFKGKVVYIDFWGVTCGPCIYDIKKYVPQLHEHYKDKDVVFVNICVGSKEKEWKEGLEKYKLNGVNLIAEEWANNPVCKAYNITAVPHYILIDKKGNIAENNAPTAGELNARYGYNGIDVLLK